ncbi:hypothetical protein L2E82_08064 [Cichorium intybus]|uniref:Uncharacterized protein n=1 Tax=Cichorium intybus TaxID=13427 RepID=A0ACB9G6G3_CICIN|nr:hypothetical protein L2E82_08064 [Cichorium intybus]
MNNIRMEGGGSSDGTIEPGSGFRCELKLIKMRGMRRVSDGAADLDMVASRWSGHALLLFYPDRFRLGVKGGRVVTIELLQRWEEDGDEEKRGSGQAMGATISF